MNFLTTKSNKPYCEYEFQFNDILLFGQESAGVPDDIHKIVKYTAILFKAFRRKNPNVLYNEFALIITIEILKRWLFLYIHDKISLESQRVFIDSK